MLQRIQIYQKLSLILLVKIWAQNATDPETKRFFVDMVYQPMLELLHFLKTNQFKEFIVSGGGVDFMREALSSVYGIPEDLNNRQ